MKIKLVQPHIDKDWPDESPTEIYMHKGGKWIDENGNDFGPDLLTALHKIKNYGRVTIWFTEIKHVRHAFAWFDFLLEKGGTYD